MATRKQPISSETAVRISMPYLTNFIVSLPLVGMVASFITSVLFTKEQIFESECGVSVCTCQTSMKIVYLVSKFYPIIFIGYWCFTR